MKKGQIAEGRIDHVVFPNKGIAITDELKITSQGLKTINHNGNETVSNINNRSIAMEGSKLDFVINSIVKKEYENSILNQNTRIVTLGESDAKISPNMFIDCDDIEARHGSVIDLPKICSPIPCAPSSK